MKNPALWRLLTVDVLAFLNWILPSRRQEELKKIYFQQPIIGPYKKAIMCTLNNHQSRTWGCFSVCTTKALPYQVHNVHALPAKGLVGNQVYSLNLETISFWVIFFTSATLNVLQMSMHVGEGILQTVKRPDISISGNIYIKQKTDEFAIAVINFFF